MNIEQILREMEEKAVKALNESAKRPADQDNGDTSTPTQIADPAGGAGGLGADAHRPADNLSQEDGAPAPQGIEEVQPANQIPDPSAVSPKTPGKGAVSLEPGKSIAEQFTKHLNAALKEFAVDVSAKSKPVLESLQLDEEFAAQATELFAGAINEAAKQHLTVINQKAGMILEGLHEAHVAVLEERADKHLNAAIVEWTQENRLAIESGIRTQIAESFMDKLKTLFESHYIELPAGKKDLYEAAIQKGDEILEQYNTEREKSITLSEEIASLKRKLIVESATRGLVATKADKVRSLSESIAFDEDFEASVSALVEEVNKSAAPASAGKHTVQDVVPLVESVEEKSAKTPSADPYVGAAAGFLSRRK